MKTEMPINRVVLWIFCSIAIGRCWFMTRIFGIVTFVVAFGALPMSACCAPLYKNSTQVTQKTAALSSSALVRYVTGSADNCKASIVSGYLTDGADPDARTKKSGTPVLFASIESGATGCVRELLRHGAAMRYVTPYGEPVEALREAAASTHCNSGLIRVLVAHGADPNVRSNSFEMTALQLSVAQQNVGCVKALLESGANVNASYGRSRTTALIIAQLVNEPDEQGLESMKSMTRLLLAHGAKPNLRRAGKGATALFVTMGFMRMQGNFHPCVACIRMLLKAGANPNIRDKAGNTPLLYVLQPKMETSFAAIQAIVEGGANVNWPNSKTGETPLMAAAAKGSEAIVSILLKHGAETCTKDKQGRMASNYARINKHVSLARKLQCK